MISPIILFVYNRPEHTKRTIEALQNNTISKESILFIYSDGSKSQEDAVNVNSVRELIDSISGFKEINIKKSSINKGLAKSIIEGVTEVIGKYGKVIVLEDDLITSSDFLEYMNKGLDLYENDDRIWSISGYSPKIELPIDYKQDVYIAKRASSWGWGTWKDRWVLNDWDVKEYSEIEKNKNLIGEFNLGGEDLFDMLKMQMDKQIDSWAIRWNYSQFINKKMTVYPKETKVLNLGFDGSGTNCNINIDRNSNMRIERTKIEFPHEIDENDEISEMFKKEHDYYGFKGTLKKLFFKLGIYYYFRNLYRWLLKNFRR